MHAAPPWQALLPEATRSYCVLMPPAEPDDDAASVPVGSAERGRWSKIDSGLTIVLTFLFSCLAGLLLLYGRLVEMQADPCGTPGLPTCDFRVIDGAGAAASLGPAVIFLITFVAELLQRRRHRITFPIPVLGIGLSIAVLMVAAQVVHDAVPIVG